MKKEEKENLLAEARDHLEALRSAPSLAMHEMLQCVLRRAGASLQDIGTDQDEIMHLLAEDGSTLSAITLTCESGKAYINHVGLTNCKRCLEDLRAEPSIAGLNSVVSTLSVLDANPEDIGSSKEELDKLSRRARVAEMKAKIEEQRSQKNIHGICEIRKILKEKADILIACGLCDEDVIELQLEVRAAYNEVSGEDCDKATSCDLN